MADIHKILSNGGPYIAKDGSFGIGETSPTSKLSLSGQQSLLDLTRATSGDAKFFVSADSARLYFSHTDIQNANIILKLDASDKSATFAGNVTINKQLFANATGDNGHILTNESNNGSVLLLKSTGDNRILTLQSDHIFSNGSLFFGDNNHTTNFRGSSYDFANGDLTFAGAATFQKKLRVDVPGVALASQPLIVAEFDGSGTDGLALISVDHTTTSTAAALGAGIRFKTGDGTSGGGTKPGYIYMQGAGNSCLKYIAPRDHKFYVDHHDNDLTGTTYPDRGTLAFTLNENASATFAGSVHLDSDSAQLQLGDDNDMQIFHNGANGIVDNNTGDLILKSDSDDIKILAEDDIVLRDNDDATNFIHCINGGAVKLYHNGSEKFLTTSAGVSITGNTIITDTANPDGGSGAGEGGSLIVEGRRDGTANLISLRARDASAPTVALPNGQGGLIRWQGFDGTDFAQMGAIAVVADGQAVANGDSPSKMIFYTTADGGEALTTALTLDKSQNAILVGDLTVNHTSNVANAPLYIGGNISRGSWNDGLVIDEASGWAATVYKRSNNPKMFTGLYSGNDNYIWMATPYSNSGTSITAPRTDAVLMARPSTDDLQIYLDTHFGGKIGLGTTSPLGLLSIRGSGDAIRVESTNTGAGGAQIDLLHFTTSPADEDTHGMINMGGYYTGTTSVYGSQILSKWTDVSERHARLEFYTTDETSSKVLTLAHDNSATFTGDINATSHGHEFGTSVFKAPDASESIVQHLRCSDGNNAATFRTTTSGRIFEIRSQNSGTIKIDSSTTNFTGDIDTSGGLRIVGGSDFGSQLCLFADSNGHTFLSGFTFTINTGGNNSRTPSLIIDSTGEVKIGKSIHLGSDSGVLTPVQYSMLIEAPSGNSTKLNMYTHGSSVFNISSDGTTAQIGWGSGADREVNIVNTGAGEISMGVGTGAPAEVFHTNRDVAGNVVGGYFTNSQANTGAEQVSLAFGLNRSGGDFVRQVKAITFGAEQQWTGTPSTVDGFLSFSTVENETIAQRMRINSGGSIAVGSFTPSGTPSADYRSIEIGRQGNTITGSPFKSALYLSNNATITAGSSAFSYRFANEASNRLDLEDGIFRFYNAAAGTVGNTITWSERMRITAGGDVGIGTDSPTTSLSVQGTTNNGINVIGVGTTANRCYVGLNSSNHGQLFVTGSSGQSPSLISSAGANSYISGGNLGIGTVSPAHTLDVQKSGDNLMAITGVVAGGLSSIEMRQSRGTLASPANSSANGDGNYIISQIYRNSGYNTAGHIGIVTGATTDDGEIRFSTALGGTVSEKMRIDENGNVGINITSPGQKLTVSSDGSGTTDVVRINHGNGSHTGHGLSIRSANTGNALHVDGAAGSGFAKITSAYNSNPSLQISGDVVAFASSDKRFKDNLEVIKNPIDKLQHLNGYTFEWNNKQDVYKGKDYGVVAQEVEKVAPELVNTRFDGYKAVKYEKLVPLLIESIKELKLEIEELKKQIK